MDDQSPDHEDIHTMGSNNPLLPFHRATETAGYPAMLVLSAICIAIAVPAIALIGMIETVWALAWAVLNMIAAATILTLGIYAAMADEEDRWPKKQPPNPHPPSPTRSCRSGGIPPARSDRLGARLLSRCEVCALAPR